MKKLGLPLVITLLAALAVFFLVPPSSANAADTVHVTVRLLDHTGASLGSAGTVKYAGNSWQDFGPSGSTMELLPGTYQFQMYYHNAMQQISGVAISGTTQDVDFQTVGVTVRLLDHTGASLGSAGTVKYAGNSWQDFGPSGSTMELLPGTYQFQMYYHNAMQQISGVAISGTTQDVDFKTTMVTLRYSGTIQYAGFTWQPFTKPSMELLPATYQFQFDGRQLSFVVGDSNLEKTIVLVKLLNSTGKGLANGIAKYYDGSWNPMGSTGGDGTLLYAINGLKGNLAFGMTYMNGYQQKWQDVSVDSIVIFQTKLVTVELRNSSNALIDTGTAVGYYTGTWNTFGSGTTSGGKITAELLPGNYCFRMTYEKTYNQKWQDVSKDATVVFQTKLVTVELRDSNNNLMDTGTNVGYYTGTWNTFGSGTTSGGQVTMELLPGNYCFRMTFADTYQQKWQDVGSNPVVVFGATKVTLQFSGAIQYYAGGAWHPFTKPTMGLFPGTYPFKFGDYQTNLTITGADMTKSVFVALLRNSNGAGLSGGTAQWYDGSWHSIPGTTGSNGAIVVLIDGLKGNLAFGMTYANTYNQKWQDISIDSIVSFQTVKATIQLKNSAGVLFDTGTNVGYYTGTWNTFGSGTTSGGKVTMELLPGNYCFRMTYLNTYNQKWQDIGTDPTVVFQTKLVTVELRDHNGNLMDTGTNVGYYTGTWNKFGSGTTSGGQVTMELLPGNYAFHLTYGNATNQIWQDIGVNPTVVFQTGQVSSSSGTCTQYYTGCWNTFTQDMELLPGNYTFHFSDGYHDTSYSITAGIVNNIH